MKRPIELNYVSQVAYTRALEAYCDRQDLIRRAEESFVAWTADDIAYRPNGLPQEFISHEVESPDAWSKWVCPKPEQYFMKCCDCGLVHEMQFKVAKYSEDDECEFVADANLQAVFRARRTTPPAAQQEQGEPDSYVTDEENEQFSIDVSNFKGADPEATKYALEQFLKNRQPPSKQEQDWSLLEATQESLREHMAMLKELQAKQDMPKIGCVNHDGDKCKEQIIQSYLEKDNSQQEQSVSVGEPVTLLPDGSAFGVISFPLPDDHWIYAPNEYRDGEYEPIDLPKPILTLASRDEVVAAVRYAVRGATMRGQETDFDPDALVQNAVYALCGPFTSAQPAPVQQEQGEPASVTYKEVADTMNALWSGNMEANQYAEVLENKKLYTTPQQRTWVGLTDEEQSLLWEISRAALPRYATFYRLIEAKLKEKNDKN